MPEDHIGTVEEWEHNQDILKDAITEMGKDYRGQRGRRRLLRPQAGLPSGRLPGPDLAVRHHPAGHASCPSALSWSTPATDGQKHRPVMIHRVVLGSIERFIGVITEHFAGAFPAWLAPVQVKVLPVTDRAAGLCQGRCPTQLDGQGFRVEVDDRNEKIGKKIREATLEKVPYMLVVGDRDMENQTVSVRTRAGEDLGAMSLEDFTAKLKEVVDSKVLQ